MRVYAIEESGSEEGSGEGSSFAPACEVSKEKETGRALSTAHSFQGLELAQLQTRRERDVWEGADHRMRRLRLNTQTHKTNTQSQPQPHNHSRNRRRKSTQAQRTRIHAQTSFDALKFPETSASTTHIHSATFAFLL